jgi:hypothetical protein
MGITGNCCHKPAGDSGRDRGTPVILDPQRGPRGRFALVHVGSSSCDQSQTGHVGTSPFIRMVSSSPTDLPVTKPKEVSPDASQKNGTCEKPACLPRHGRTEWVRSDWVRSLVERSSERCSADTNAPADSVALNREKDLRKKGLEPLRPFGHQLLRLTRLPIPPLPLATSISPRRYAAPVRALSRKTRIADCISLTSARRTGIALADSLAFC